jgi:predicted kinase
MAKLIMCKGLPASGKSTYARDYVVKSGNAARINRDDLRAMLFDSVWTGKRESVVVDIEKAIAEVCIKHGLTPVIDDTNLTDRHKDMWSGFAKAHDVAFSTTAFDASLETCIARDRNRERPIGAAVIYRLALNAGMIDFGEKPIILCDIDGTLACGKHREVHLAGEKKDWRTYYSLLPLDSPIDLVVRWVRELAKTHTICLVSGRPDTYQHETIRWMDVHGVPFDYLFMRAGGDKRPDTEVKKMILDKLPKDKIEFVIDDRPSVCRMWKAEGLTVFPVRGQCEEF